ncbi:MAG: hypothetical protein ACTS6J_00020 [Burkholderiales bacterium]
MTKPLARHLPGFDFSYRPLSYFEDLEPGTLVVASILEEEWCKDVQARLASGDYDPLVWGEWLTESKLDDSTRRLIGRSHPYFMGGEYLPSLGDNEIEIARIVLASVTQDVISVLARRAGARIAPRISRPSTGSKRTITMSPRPNTAISKPRDRLDEHRPREIGLPVAPLSDRIVRASRPKCSGVSVPVFGD